MFTEGFKVQLVLKPGPMIKQREKQVIERVRESLGEIEVVSVFEGTVNLLIVEDNLKLSNCFETISNLKSSKEIIDFSVSVGSLEDVFLRIVKEYQQKS